MRRQGSFQSIQEGEVLGKIINCRNYKVIKYEHQVNMRMIADWGGGGLLLLLLKDKGQTNIHYASANKN